MDRTLFLIFTLLTAVVLSCQNDPKPSSLVKTNLNEARLDTLHTELHQIINESSIPGLGVCIVRGDSQIYSQGFGYADLQNKHPFTTQTKHSLASLSKTFVGIAIMKLVEEGKLNLEDTVNQFIPFRIQNPLYPKTPITVKHLVTHTSSLNDDWDDGDKRPSQLVEISRYDTTEIPNWLKEDIYYFDGSVLAMGAYLRNIYEPGGRWYQDQNYSNFKPGSQFEYCNEGATLAALIVEQVSGMSFSRFTQTYIFEPLQMSQTSWYYQLLDSTMSKLYVQDDSAGIFEFPRFNETGYPAGDLKSNTADLSRYLIEIRNGFHGKGKLLQEASYQTLLQPQWEGSKGEGQDMSALNDEYKVGVFWAISEPGLRLHKGGSTGVYSILYYNPKTDVGVASYCNLAHPDFGKIVEVLRAFERDFN